MSSAKIPDGDVKNSCPLVCQDASVRAKSRAFMPVVIFTVIVLMVASVVVPQNAWDLLGHLGSALDYSIKDKQKLLDETYKIASEALDESAMAALISGKPERIIWSSDSESFSQLLPFYQPRILVTLPTNLVYRIGWNPVTYLQWQSSVFAAIGVFIFSLLITRRALPGFLLMFPFIILISGILDIARFEGPDAVSFCIFAFACVGLVRKSGWGLFALAIIPLARSDMAIISVMILSVWVFIRPEQRKLAVIALITSIVTYLGVNHYFSNYGWVTQFYVAQIEYQTFPADVDNTFSLKDYFLAVFRGLTKLPYNFQFHFFVLSYLCVLYKCFDILKKQSLSVLSEHSLLVLGLLSGLFVFVHFMIFPSMHARYFGGQYMLVALAALQVACSYLHMPVTREVHTSK